MLKAWHIIASKHALLNSQHLYKPFVLFQRFESNDILASAQQSFIPKSNIENTEFYKNHVILKDEAESINHKIVSEFEAEQPGLIDANNHNIIDYINLEPSLNALGEPSLQSYGLGSMYPPGLLQQALEYLHANLELPWWAAIVTTTCIIRFLLFPIVIKSQRYTTRMSNAMPSIQKYQTQIFEARRNGDQGEVLRMSLLLRKTLKDNDVKPLKTFMMPLFQAPIFLSFFWGLRSMANAPIESMQTGGLFWFTDLTLADPYYLLPIITCSTLFLTLEFGVESGMRANMMPVMKYVMRGMPVVVFFFTLNFPAAILCYWCTNNFLSLLQVGFLRLPGVRPYFGIERAKPPPAPDNKTLKMKFKDSMENNKILSEIEDRIKMDAFKFKQAGLGPVPKTFVTDPTQILPSSKIDYGDLHRVNQEKETNYRTTDIRSNIERDHDKDAKMIEEIKERIRKRN